jgi:mRNA interferase MazF
MKTAVSVPDEVFQAVERFTSNVRLAAAPGNVLLPAASTGQSRDSVANVSLIVAVDRSFLEDRVGRVSARQLDLILAGIDLLLDR